VGINIGLYILYIGISEINSSSAAIGKKYVALNPLIPVYGKKSP
jgi:hypothetical protein